MGFSKIGIGRMSPLYFAQIQTRVRILYTIILVSALLDFATPFATLHSKANTAPETPSSSMGKNSLIKDYSHVEIRVQRPSGIRRAITSSGGRNVLGVRRGDLTEMAVSTVNMDEDLGFDVQTLEMEAPSPSFDPDLVPQTRSVLPILDNPSLLTGRILVIVASAIYGTNFPAVKMLDKIMPLSISAALRFGLAGAIVTAIVYWQQGEVDDGMETEARRKAFSSGAEVGLWYCIGYIAQAEALHTVSAGKSAFFNALAVIVVPILDSLWKQKKLDGKALGAVSLACLGVGLLELGPTGDIQLSSGDLLAFTQTVFFGIGYWRLESHSQEHSQQAAQLTVGQLCAVSGGATMFALAEYMMGHVSVTGGMLTEWATDPFIIGSLLWTGLVSTALALYLETVALKVVSATELTLLMTTVSLWGAMFAYVGLGEVMTPIGMLGGALIMGGCILGNISPAGPTKQPLQFYNEADEIDINIAHPYD